MAKEWAEWFYKSKAWIECRESYYISQHGICERCQGAGLIVHHKIYLTPENINNTNITLNWDNLELVCQRCHNQEHHGGDEDMTAEGLTFNQWGELVNVGEDD